MDGVLIIDKPAGITSHDVVARVRRILSERRVGHTGTLDPFATGVMVVLVGKATRLAQFLSNDAKEYRATIQLGVETDTGDLTGTALGASSLADGRVVTADEIKAILPQFTGEIDQVPPMYSAKKRDGKRLYELARAGVEVAREAVRVSIYDLEVEDSSDLRESGRVTVRVACSAGTYIRTLAEDIGRKLGVGAHLTSLERTAAGKFTLSASIDLDELADTEEAAALLLPPDSAVSHLPEFTLDATRIEKTRNGLSTRVSDHAFADGEFVRMTVVDKRELIAIGRFDAEENCVRPNVVLV